MTICRLRSGCAGRPTAAPPGSQLPTEHQETQKPHEAATGPHRSSHGPSEDSSKGGGGDVLGPVPGAGALALRPPDAGAPPDLEVSNRKDRGS